MARSLKVKRSGTTQTDHFHLRGFRMRIEVIEAVGDMTEHIFVFRRHPKDPHTDEVFDEFCTVANPVHLADYPVGDPDPDIPFPFFRKSFVEFDVKSQAEADRCWRAIKVEICKLVDTLNNSDELVLEDEIICGEVGEPTDSISLSESITIIPIALAIFTLTLGELSGMTIEQLNTLLAFPGIVTEVVACG